MPAPISASAPAEAATADNQDLKSTSKVHKPTHPHVGRVDFQPGDFCSSYKATRVRFPPLSERPRLRTDEHVRHCNPPFLDRFGISSPSCVLPYSTVSGKYTDASLSNIFWNPRRSARVTGYAPSPSRTMGLRHIAVCSTGAIRISSSGRILYSVRVSFWPSRRT